LNVRVYEKSPTVEYFQNGNVKKDSVYQEIDLEAIMNLLQPGEIMELDEVYLGKAQKFPTRLVVHKLTPEQTEKRLTARAANEKKKNITYRERTKRLSGISVYITDTPKQIVTKEQVHELYSLRWQIEILFKTWKSMFQIDRCKPVKLPRFECHVYGRLIAIFLSSSLMFQMRSLLLLKKKQEVSEFKVIGMVKDYFRVLHQALRQTLANVQDVLWRLYQMIQKNGRKSHRYEKKTVFDILGVIYEREQKVRRAA